MYNQNMQQAKKKNVFKNAIILLVIGALFIISGGTANTIHRNISLGRVVQIHEESLKESREISSKSSKTDEQKEKDTMYYKEVRESIINNAKTAQVYNIIGLILSVVSVLGLITFMFFRNKQLFKIGYYISIGCLVLSANIFYEVFSGTFLSFYEREYNYIYASIIYGKTAIFVHPWLRLLYITLSLVGWIMIFIAFRNVKKNADIIVAKAQQTKQMKAQQILIQQQQQFVQQEYVQPTQQQQFIQPQYQQTQYTQPSQSMPQVDNEYTQQ